MNVYELGDEFESLVTQKLTEQSCKRIIEIIRLTSEDDEVAHGMEDTFREAVLRDIDHPFARLALQTSLIDFSRWCA